MIVLSAIMYPNGEIVTAKHHYQIVWVQAQFGITSDDAIQGFIDHTGEFYIKPEAKKLAIESGQLKPSFKGELQSEDLWPNKAKATQS